MTTQSTGNRIVPILISLPFMAIGVWSISMAIEGKTPAGPLDKPGDAIIMGIFGGVFCLSAVLGIANAVLHGSATGRTVVATIATATFILFGLCFLSVAILQPGGISSTTSVSGIEVSRSKGGRSGAIIFYVVGVLPIIFARQIFRSFGGSSNKKSRLPK